MASESRIWTPIDFERDGKQSDCLRLPHSTDDSAYGWIPIPLICVRNGVGPTALLIAGNHGDEYEGQVALMNIARTIAEEDIQGRVIIIPSLNFPAVMAGCRVSPIDDGNLNRLFPGRAHGTLTEMIAHYVSDVLIPMADLVVDLHSGGRSLSYIPSALIRPGPDPAAHKKLLDLSRLFGAPITFISNGQGGGGATTLSATAEQLQIPAITTELGGAATLREPGLSLAEQGVKRLLKDMGIAPQIDTLSPSPTRFMEVPGSDYFLYAPVGGIFEPAAGVGDEVGSGQFAGRIHFPDYPDRDPESVYFPKDGMVACQRFPALTKRGDCLFKLMCDVTPSLDKSVL